MFSGDNENARETHGEGQTTVPPAHRQVFSQRWQDVVTRASRLASTSNRKVGETLPAADQST